MCSCCWERGGRRSHLLKAVLLQTDDVQVKVRAQSGGLVEREPPCQTVPVRLKDNAGRKCPKTFSPSGFIYIAHDTIVVGRNAELDWLLTGGNLEPGSHEGAPAEGQPGTVTHGEFCSK